MALHLKETYELRKDAISYVVEAYRVLSTSQGLSDHVRELGEAETAVAPPCQEGDPGVVKAGKEGEGSEDGEGEPVACWVPEPLDQTH